MVDNCDADISSHNDKFTTNSSAILATQPSSSNQSEYLDNKAAMNRLNMNELTKPIDYNINVDRYNDPLK